MLFIEINHFSYEKEKAYFNIKFQNEKTPFGDSLTKGLFQTFTGGQQHTSGAY